MSAEAAATPTLCEGCVLAKLTACEMLGAVEPCPYLTPHERARIELPKAVAPRPAGTYLPSGKRFRW